MVAAEELHDYHVLSTLGYGARSTIFAVKDDDGHTYALKRVVKRSHEDNRFLEQAISEYEVARRFDHPNLRRVYKLIRQRKLLRTSEVLVLMELVDGQTLEQKRPPTLAGLLRVMMEVAKALGHMHEKGWVHADIKPNNLLVTPEHHVKIIDFGQSCPTGQAKERIQGTPDYIAPEQVKRRPITPATDAFNLGASLYWMLTGKYVPTMIPKGKAGITYRDDQNITPPRDLNREVPPALSSLVMNCVKSDPSERPQTMKLVLDRLEMSLGQLERGNGNHTP